MKQRYKYVRSYIGTRGPVNLTVGTQLSTYFDFTTEYIMLPYFIIGILANLKVRDNFGGVNDYYFNLNANDRIWSEASIYSANQPLGDNYKVAGSDQQYFYFPINMYLDLKDHPIQVNEKTISFYYWIHVSNYTPSGTIQVYPSYKLDIGYIDELDKM